MDVRNSTCSVNESSWPPDLLDRHRRYGAATRPNPADRHVMANQTLLPTADTLERYLAIRGDHARLRRGVTALCDRLGLHGVDIVRFTDGSLPVYAVGQERVLKLYPG